MGAWRTLPGVDDGEQAQRLTVLATQYAEWGDEADRARRDEAIRGLVAAGRPADEVSRLTGTPGTASFVTPEQVRAIAEGSP